MTEQLLIEGVLKLPTLPKVEFQSRALFECPSEYSQILEFRLSPLATEEEHQSFEALRDKVFNHLGIEVELKAGTEREYDDGRDPERVEYRGINGELLERSGQYTGKKWVQEEMPRLGAYCGSGNFGIQVVTYSKERLEHAMQHLIANLKESFPELARVEIVEEAEQMASERAGDISDAAGEFLVDNVTEIGAAVVKGTEGREL